MAITIKKRGKIYHYEFKVKGRPRIRESAGTEDEEKAKIIAAKRYQEIFDEIRLGVKPERKWTEAVTRWARIAKDKKSFETDLHRLRVLDPYLNDKTLNEMTRVFIDDVMDELEDERELSTASINRYLSVIRSILKMAHQEWEWIDKIPKLPKRNEAKKRVRWITEQEARRLLEVVPVHVKWQVIFTLNTGLRKANLLGLKWRQVDMDRRVAWVYGDEAKGKKDIIIPLNNDALAVLAELRSNHHEYVFTYRSKPITKPSRKDWIKWCSRAGITEFRWHDLRHTWASWFVQRGGGLQELMELGGWSSYEMVLKYAHLSPGRLHRAAGLLETGLHKECGE